MSVEEAVEILKADPDIEYAEPNYLRYAMATIPDDTDFTRLWGLNNSGQSVNGIVGTADRDIDAPEAWDIATGSSTVVIAVLDSGGAYDHADLSDNIWSNTDEIPDNGVDDDGNGYVDDLRGWDFVDNDNDPSDSYDHGTHVAGTIAAKGNNGIGVTGVCWTAKIMPLKFLDASGAGTVLGEIAAIDYAIQNGANIINASYGGSGLSQIEYDAIANANAAGIVFVAAAGNAAADIDTTPVYPAGHDLANIVSVASTNQDDALSSFSNYGHASVDVAAPGENIYSTQPTRQTIWIDDFDDGNLDGWNTGGTKNTWGATDLVASSGSYSLTDSPGGDYQNDTASWAEAAVPDLSSYAGLKLEFQFQGVSKPGDFLYVQTSTDGAQWTNQTISIEGLDYADISGDFSDDWYAATVDLGAYDGTDTVYVRFSFVTDGDSDVDEGWHIDDVTVTAAGYQFMQGTSMATPHVAGLAGLILARFPGLPHLEVKDRILNGVDSKGYSIATGGRINAFNSLNLPSKPTGLVATLSSFTSITLRWNDVSNEEGYRIERQTGDGSAFSEIATVAADQTSHIDTGVVPGKTYHYRITAFNTSGNSSYAVTTALNVNYANGGGGGGGCFIGAVRER
jgi:subtilisin family serine protease